MTSLTATEARKGLFDLIKGVNEQHAIYHIRHRNGDAVLMSEDEYASLIETLELLSEPGFRQEFERGRREADEGNTLGFEEAFGEKQ